MTLFFSAALVAGASPSQAAMFAFGSGEATFYPAPGVPCPPGSDHSALLGASDGLAWTFAVGDVNPTPTPSCLIVAGEAFRGSWDPLVGGCIPGLAGGRLCLTNPVGDDVAATYDLELVTRVAGTVTGTASLTFA